MPIRAGTVCRADLDAEIKIWIRSRKEPLILEFRKDTHIHDALNISGCCALIFWVVHSTRTVQSVKIAGEAQGRCLVIKKPKFAQVTFKQPHARHLGHWYPLAHVSQNRACVGFRWAFIFGWQGATKSSTCYHISRTGNLDPSIGAHGARVTGQPNQPSAIAKARPCMRVEPDLWRPRPDDVEEHEGGVGQKECRPDDFDPQILSGAPKPRLQRFHPCLRVAMSKVQDANTHKEAVESAGTLSVCPTRNWRGS
jgi:hypothetical protein